VAADATPTRALGVDQRAGFAKVVTAPSASAGASVKLNWRLTWPANIAVERKNGYIVQHVKVYCWIWNTADNSVNTNAVKNAIGDTDGTQIAHWNAATGVFEYWEVWRVFHGEIMGATIHQIDGFTAPKPVPGTYGYWEEEGQAQFYPGDGTVENSPIQTHAVKMAGSDIFSSFTQPAGVNDAGAVFRGLHSEWYYGDQYVPGPFWHREP
jgi:hypothetical protein